MQAPKVYIIILNYRRWQDSLECLLSVLQSTYINFSVFVIDNDSGNNSLEHLVAGLGNKFANKTLMQSQQVSYVLLTKEQLNNETDLSNLPKVILIQNDKNAGFAAGNNVVLKFLRDKDAYFWLINPDMVVNVDSLAELVKFSIPLPSESIIGSVVRSYSGNHELIVYGGNKVNFLSATVTKIQKPGSLDQLDYISGGCLFTHTSNLTRLGLLPEKYFLYWEETEWCYRAKQSGHGLYVCTTSTCYDKGSTVIGKSFMADYYYVRNSLLFISEFRKKNIPVVVLFLGVRFLMRVITCRWSRARGVFKGTMDFFKMKPDEAK